MQASFAGNRDVTSLPGGFPLLAQGAVVGGVGVAGGNFEQDQAIGAVAAAAPAAPLT